MRNIDLDSLQIFKAVADFGGITNAASQLNRVQSNITTRVKNLEQRLGVMLFNRHGGKLSLSAEGQTLYRYAERLLDLSAEAELAVKQSVARGLLRIGTLESTAAARLPPLLAAFHERFPDIQIELVSGSSDHLISLVHRHDIEAAFVSDPYDASGLEGRDAFVEELVLIAAKNCAVENARSLEGHTILTFVKGCSYRRIYEAWLEACEVKPARIMEVASYHAITACAAAGTGIAIMPRSVLTAVQAEHLVKALALPSRFAKVRTRLVWRDGYQSPTLKALLGQIAGRS